MHSRPLTPGCSPRRPPSGLHRALAGLLLVAAAGCDLFGSDPTPTTVTVNPSSLDLDAVGDSRTLSVEVLDEEGRPFPNPRIGWGTSDGGVATVSDAGVLTTQGNGTATITATVGRASGSMAVRVAQSVATITLISGGGQTGLAGEQLQEPVVVLARDRNDNVARGVTLTFGVEAGGGSFSPASSTSDAQGLASSSWTLGTEAGIQQRGRVSAGGGAAAITLDALSVAGPPDGLEILAGQDQAAPRERPLPTPVAVRVRDRFLNPVAGITVTFEAEAGSGSFEPPSIATGPTGEATSVWTLGSPLGSQGARVLVQGLTPVPLSATALPVPAGLQVVEGDGQTAAAGTAVPILPAVLVEEAGGAPVVGLTVRFSVTAGGGSVSGGEAVTDAEGVARPEAWVLGPRAGVNRLRATVEGLEPVEFTASGVAGPPAGLRRVSGSGQAGLAGGLLASPLRARVVDAFGNPVQGVEVQFRAQQGSVSTPAATSGNDGLVQSAWTLGAQEGTQTATAFVLDPDLGTVTFVAVTGNVASDYSVDIRYLAPLSPALERMTEEAAARWATLVTGNLSPVQITAPPGACGFGEPALNEVVDDVLIYVRIQPIDGPGNVLGGAGWCAIRLADNLPALGVILLDSDDLERLPAAQSEAVILHEIAHVLGFGTLWGPQFFDLRRNPSLPDSPGADTHFTGPAAIAAFDALGGERYNAAKVPVENTLGGQGTRDSHWRASVMNDELMTGFINAESNPLSAITVESLRDLGYQVDPGAADLYEVTLTPAQQLVPGSGSIFLGNDILLTPILVLDERGDIIRVIPRDLR
jgi:hypothetical protein